METATPTTEIKVLKKKWPEITLASVLVTTGPTTTTELLDH